MIFLEGRLPGRPLLPTPIGKPLDRAAVLPSRLNFSLPLLERRSLADHSQLGVRPRRVLPYLTLIIPGFKVAQDVLDQLPIEADPVNHARREFFLVAQYPPDQRYQGFSGHGRLARRWLAKDRRRGVHGTRSTGRRGNVIPGRLVGRAPVGRAKMPSEITKLFFKVMQVSFFGCWFRVLARGSWPQAACSG